MAGSVRVEGVDDVLEAMEGLADSTVWEQALKRACSLVERTAKQNAPKGNGDLRRSITSRIERDGEDLIGVVYTPLEYAPYVEYGTGLFAVNGGRKDVPWNYQDDKGEWHTTSGQHPQPFLEPALNENREEIIRILREGKTDG